MNKNKTLLLGFIALLLCLLFVIVFVWSPNKEPLRHNSVPLELKSEPQGGGFSVEILNADLSLENLQGKTVILYFGYTQCPDICPTTLSHIAKALKQMTADELSVVQALFVSIDPEQDNTARLEEYSQYFHESLLGATAEPDDIRAIGDRYGVNVEFVESDLTTAGYIINHSSAIYIIDPSGSLRRTLPFGTTAEMILESVRESIGN